MPTVETRYEHIVLGEDGVPLITDAGMKVVDLVAQSMAYGWSPDELHYQHPHLSLGQIHSALAYYWDHVEEMNADIERRLEGVDAIRSRTRVPPFIDRLKQKGLI